MPGSRSSGVQLGKPRAVPGRRSQQYPPQRPPSHTGATASTTHASAPTTIAARMLAGASRACSAASDRGRARKPTPKAFTMAATPSPVVSATAPTASGMANASSVLAGSGAWIRLCTSSHSLTNPAPSGSPDAPSAATPNAAVVTGIRRASPPRPIQVAQPGARPAPSRQPESRAS